MINDGTRDQAKGLAITTVTGGVAEAATTPLINSVPANSDPTASPLDEGISPPAHSPPAIDDTGLVNAPLPAAKPPSDPPSYEREFGVLGKKLEQQILDVMGPCDSSNLTVTPHTPRTCSCPLHLNDAWPYVDDNQCLRRWESPEYRIAGPPAATRGPLTATRGKCSRKCAIRV